METLRVKGFRGSSGPSPFRFTPPQKICAKPVWAEITFFENQKRGNKKTANPSSYAHIFYAAESVFCIDATL